jgi:hypothetical protein
MTNFRKSNWRKLISVHDTKMILFNGFSLHIWTLFDVTVFHNFNVTTIILKTASSNLIILKIVLFVLLGKEWFHSQFFNYLLVEVVYPNYDYCNCERC